MSEALAGMPKLKISTSMYIKEFTVQGPHPILFTVRS